MYLASIRSLYVKNKAKPVAKSYHLNVRVIPFWQREDFLYSNLSSAIESNLAGTIKYHHKFKETDSSSILNQVNFLEEHMQIQGVCAKTDNHIS